jgi:predicted amino acid-binding ACT domain protein
MKLWDFGRMASGKIVISPKIGDPLGLVNGSEVFSSMFKYEAGKREAFEIVLSPFGPENYREIAYVTIQVRDEPGALAQASQFLKSLNVDILNSETVSSIPNAVMIWEMLVDLSFFGDSASLKAEFDNAKAAKSPSIDLVDCLRVEDSDLATRYTRGASLDSENVKTKAFRKTEKKASIIENGSFDLPQAYVSFLGRDSAPVMLIGDLDSWVLSVVFLDDDASLFRMRMDLPDRPGSLHEIMKILGSESINVVAGYTNVLVYYERMTCELVADLRRSGSGKPEETRMALKEKISALGAQFSLVDFSPVDF